MEFDQSVRQQWRRIRAAISEWRTRARVGAGRAAESGRDALPRLGLAARIALGVVLVLFVIYPALAWWHSTIDDDPGFTAKVSRPATSRTVANIAGLINREVKKHGWTANAPWFSPNALLDDMPNYQIGIVSALANVVHGLNDHRPDQDLQGASDLLHTPPDAWLWNSSGSQYRLAARNLRDYNKQIADGQIGFDRSAANLATVLDRIATDLDGAASGIEHHIATQSGWPFDSVSDDVFYNAKGRLYAYAIVLDGVGADFSGVIAQRGLGAQWTAMMASLKAGAAMRPWMVMNGAPDSGLFACTLCGEGFYLLRTRDQLRAIQASLSP